MRPLFIVGAPRSGTTLLKDLLRRCCSDVYLPPAEMQMIPAFSDLTGDAARLATYLDSSIFAQHLKAKALWPAQAELEALVDPADRPGTVRRLALAIAAAEGASEPLWWGDKTPSNVFCLDRLGALFPGLHVLSITRDPRDTVQSMRRAWGRSLTRGATIWRDAERALAATTLPHHHVTYEALTDDPAATLAPVAEWLGVPFDPAGFDGYRTEERWGRAAGSTGVVSVRDRWRSDLSPAEIRRIESIAFHEMQAAGYAPAHADAAWAPPGWLLKLVRLRDGVQSLRAYVQDWGLVGAVSYKLRQWRAARNG